MACSAVDGLSRQQGTEAEQVRCQELPEFWLFWRTLSCFISVGSCLGYGLVSRGCDHCQCGSGNSGWLQTRQCLSCKAGLWGRGRDVLHIWGDDPVAIHLRANTFEAAKNQSMLITQDDIAEAAHNLDDQAVVGSPVRAAAIACCNLDNALPAWLLDSLNACALE